MKKIRHTLAPLNKNSIRILVNNGKGTVGYEGEYKKSCVVEFLYGKDKVIVIGKPLTISKIIK